MLPSERNREFSPKLNISESITYYSGEIKLVEVSSCGKSSSKMVQSYYKKWLESRSGSLKIITLEEEA